MKTQHYHAVIWIDHHEAKIFHFNATDVESQTLPSNKPSMHIHHRANTTGSGHEALDDSFLHDIVMAVASSGEIMIVGPGNAKTELMKHIAKHDPQLKAKILGVETVDHPSDGQIVAYARKFFHSTDSMRP